MVPVAQREFGVDRSYAAWVVTAFSLGTLPLLAGRAPHSSGLGGGAPKRLTRLDGAPTMAKPTG